MPSAVDILQAKREKAEGKTETPEQEINKVIEQVDDKIAVKTKKEDPIVEDSPIDDEEVDVDETVDDLIEENLDEDEVERLTAQQLKEAKDLYKALLNPAARGPLVQALAQQSGLNLSNIETKKEAKVAKKDITARLKEALGDELGFLADKMGPVIESVIEEERQGVEEISKTVELRQIEREAQQTFAKLKKETNGLSTKYEEKMIQLMDKFPSSPGLSTEEYIRGIAMIAMNGKLTQVATQKVVNKIARNAKDVPGRLTSKGSGAREEPSRGAVPDKKLGLKGSVLFALGQLQNSDMPKAANRK
jgi:hypothetical protein